MIAILRYRQSEELSWRAKGKRTLPIIDVLKNLVGPSFAVGMEKPLLHPHNDMVFESPLNDLMKKVRCYHFVYVSSREMRCE
jgi:hypothetical protein